MVRGRLISFEGIDGCGKSTQIRLAADYLRESGWDVKLLQEPGGTPAGERIRQILLSRSEQPDPPEMDPLTEFLLFASSRAQLVKQVIKPLLEAGSTHRQTRISVLLDRFADSSLAYQGYGRGLDLGFIRAVNRVATTDLTPDLTILFDIAPESALARLTGATDRIERLGAPFFHRVRYGFLELAAAEPERWQVIDGAGDRDAVFNEVVKALETRLQQNE